MASINSEKDQLTLVILMQQENGCEVGSMCLLSCNSYYVRNCFTNITQVHLCVSRDHQSRTGGHCWSKVLLPIFPCWWQLTDMD